MGSWRPICFGRQFTEYRECCEGCPFKATCAELKEERRERMASKYSDYELYRADGDRGR